jgi:hypothetical protein
MIPIFVRILSSACASPLSKVSLQVDHLHHKGQHPTRAGTNVIKRFTAVSCEF